MRSACKLALAALATMTGGLATGEPLAIKPLQPIIEEGGIVGFSANDPGVEFSAPNAWLLKKNGAVLQPLRDGHRDLVLVVEPTYALADRHAAINRDQGLFKVYLPVPMQLLSAKLYVNEFLGDLQAEFVPYPGNSNPGFYFRIKLDPEQMTTLDRLTRQNLTFTGEVTFAIDLDDFHTTTTVPLKVALPYYLRNDPVTPPSAPERQERFPVRQQQAAD